MELSRDLENEIHVIEFHMLDKIKFYPLTLMTSLSVRGLLYPLTLVRTRLQTQTGKTVYKGMFDAIVKIGRREGFRAFYQGFGVSCIQIPSSVIYITIYESVRQYWTARLNNGHISSMIAGFSASCVNQLFIVPLDIVSQHLMLMEGKKSATNKRIEEKLQKLQKIHISDEIKNSKFGAVRAICREIMQSEGLRGFYKGSGVSLAVYSAGSGFWWLFYNIYGSWMIEFFPVSTSRLALKMVAAPLAGISSVVLTNPFDVLRTRVQVLGESYSETLKILWREERWNILTKGISARMTTSCLFSLMIAFGYESVKRFSLKEEFKADVRW
ncbi:solute carrier family 25 member 44-like [Mytilus californianus]|uniref:solute carrier family 25 member 44-like n=1 Tax=Mytilus californianus TaxID=6549 RepID=UPI00224628AF|nr:solute carrier family 25 member 44-like [Mytilus californianus]XP_052084605.1 solute carrier family 25 member 44-like [Mytilus californianus]